MTNPPQAKKKRKRRLPPTAPPPTGALLQVTSQLVAAIAAILAAAPSPLLAFIPLTYLFVSRKFAQRDKAALAAALRILESMPPEPVEGGTAQQYVTKLNEMRRAAYLILCFNRLLQAYNAGGIAGMQAAARTELRYFNQHVEADGLRMRAANEIDRLAEKYGPTLGWYAKLDGKTTQECRDANGKNFSASKPPRIGWPGVVHVNCRCKAGPPHRNAIELAKPEPPIKFSFDKRFQWKEGELQEKPAEAGAEEPGDMTIELRNGVPYLIPAGAAE